MQNKKILIWLILIMFLVIQLFGNTMTEEKRMVKFHPEGKTLEEIKSIVKAEGKIGLIYFHLEGCGPCKALEEQVFHDKDAVEYVESNFTPFWIDVDKNTGPKIGFHYAITAFPTLVFISDEGEIIDKFLGYGGKPEEYLKRLNELINTKNTLISLKEEFKENPENIELALKYADKLNSSANYNEAIEMYEKLIDKIKEDSIKGKVSYNLGFCYERVGDSDKACEIYVKGLEKGIIKEYKEEIYWKIGDIYYKNDEYNEAIKYYEMIPEKAEEFEFYNNTTKYGIERVISDVKRKLPLIYIKAGDKEKGIYILEESFSKAWENKDYMKISSLVFSCLQNNIYKQKALSWAKKVPDLSEFNDERTLIGYANFLREIGDYEKSIDIHKKLIEIAKTDANRESSWRSIASLYFLSGKEEEGEKVFDRLYNNAKNDAWDMYLLVSLCNRYNVNLKKAEKWAEEAVELSEGEYKGKREAMFYSSPGFILNIYAEILYKNGNIQKAIEIEEKALRVALREDIKKTYKENLEKYKKALK